MTVIGVLLTLVAALILLAVLVSGSDDPAVLDVGLFEISTSTMGVFLIGAATVLILVSGLELLRSGLRRSLRRRRELKQARAVVAKHEKHERPTEPKPHPDERTGSGPAGPQTGSGPATGTQDTRGSTH